MADRYDDDKKKFAGCLTKGFLVIVAIVLVVFALATFRVGGAPEVAIEPAAQGIGAATPVTVRLSEGGRGLEAVRVELVQGEQVHVVGEKDYEPRGAIAFWGPRTTEDEFTVEVGRRSVEGLTGGEATIRVVAERAGTWLRKPEPVVEEVTLPVRLTPPSLQVLSNQHYVTQGGSEVVVYRVGDTAVRSGVEAGDHFFPGHPLPGGGERERFALFAVPYNLAEQSKVRLVAVDDVGNRRETSFIDRFTAKPYSEGTIELSDGFLDKVVPEIMSNTPDMPDQGSPIENYVYINSEMREKNRAFLQELARKSVDEFLWHREFLPMPGGQVMSPFATRRTYVYNEEKVDEQFHLGYDLASTRMAPVPAANNGIVMYADFLGIYGNVVILDHGYGLMSLYGHLSSIDVEPGQRVERGQPIGRTGETGLAGGDHLHFGILLGGLPVNPVEYWDDHWLTDRLSRKLGDAWSLEEG
ncbi:MAG TPA: M23 family metallopeptidase [Thermoanaerobaculia bacterium]|nr:M23 family metallopeptidase [Thermoanaerobaculia bacterium]